jgi:predicted dehydrogenase
MKPVRVGIIGCGNISGIYLRSGARFAAFEIAACADLDRTRARTAAAEHGIPRACTVKQMLADKSIELVVNLTVPKAHFDVSMAALDAGKHVYSEKPLALSPEQGRALLDRAAGKGLLVGCAPDTFLGAAHQTARKIVDDGWIGAPVSATAFMQCHGHESWHPNPFFYYEPGGGPMFDMGPYYLTALVNLLGPVRRVCASAQSAFAERTATCAEHAGASIPVQTPTHIAAVADFAGGAVGTLVMSFDVWRASLHCIEVHGTEGSMQVPDPNGFGGPVRLWRPGQDDWKELPHSHAYADNARGLGVADMAGAIRGKRPHRASGALAFHVLEVMQACLDSSRDGRHLTVDSAPERPAPLPMNLRDGAVD